MFLRDAQGDLVEVLDIQELIDPHKEHLHVRYQAGEEIGDPVEVKKAELRFPSGEALPRCWLDPHYRVHF